MIENKKNKPVCLITGGSSGIGLATAIRFASEGYDIAICGRRSEALERAQKTIVAAGESSSIECQVLVVDLSEVEAARKLGHDVLNHFGSIDVLVNNAATAPLAPFEEISEAEFESAIDTNIRSIFYLTQIVWKSMKRKAGISKKKGVVVNISSMAAVDPFPGFSLYGACKSWLELMTLALATEGQDSGLRVCSVRPGAVETPLLRGLFPDYPADQCVSPEQIADAVWGCVNHSDRYPSGKSFEVSTRSIESSE